MRYRFSDITINYDSKRVPLSAKQREERKGKYPYYGAQGIIDYIDDYIFDGKYLLIAEDGENLKSKKQKIAQLANGRYWVNNHAHIVQTNEKCLIEYLYYIFNITDISGYITGSAQPKLSQANLNAIELEIPPMQKQEKIVSILSALDDKIELNQKINKNLERQAQTIFQQTFPYTVTDTLPDGWRVGTVGEIIELHDAKRIPLSGTVREQMKKKTYPYYGAASLMDYVDEYIFDGKYLLLGEDGTVVDASGYPILQYVWGKFWVNNHAHILTGKRGFNVESLYLLFRQIPVKSIVTGAVQPKISQTNLRSIQVIIPLEDKILSFNDQIEPLFSQIRLNEEQNKTLDSLRNTLLPKLMAVEIDF